VTQASTIGVGIAKHVFREHGADPTRLRSRTNERRTTEAEVAVHALNRVLEFGRSISVRMV